MIHLPWHTQRGHPESHERVRARESGPGCQRHAQAAQAANPEPITVERCDGPLPEHIRAGRQVARGGGAGWRGGGRRRRTSRRNRTRRRWLAAGGVVTAVEAVLRGDYHNAFALFVRRATTPPATTAKASACLTSIAIGGGDPARGRPNLNRGSLSISTCIMAPAHKRSSTTTRRCCSAQSSSGAFLPGTGHWTETGESAGASDTVNVPMKPGLGRCHVHPPLR